MNCGDFLMNSRKACTMVPYIKEYYQRGGQPILLVMTLQRRALQAWHPDIESGRMERLDTLIMDVLHADARAISKSDFESLCSARGIDPAVPEKGIQLSFKLSALNSSQKSNTVPVPAEYQPAAWPARNDNRPSPAI
jgi:hypothetical protein